jgi:alkylated DNA repair dioxygenase AlkB
VRASSEPMMPMHYWRAAICSVLFVTCAGSTAALSRSVAVKTASLSSQQLLADLQNCVTAEQVLERIAPRLLATSTVVDTTDGSLASLTLVRLSKLLTERDNESNSSRLLLSSSSTNLLTPDHEMLVHLVGECLAGCDVSNKNLEALIEGVKAYALLVRLTRGGSTKAASSMKLLSIWEHVSGAAVQTSHQLEPHHLSGLKWAFDTFRLAHTEDISFHPVLQKSYEELRLPFHIIPGCLDDIIDLSVAALTAQVQFKVDEIRTSSNKVVQERRRTAWQGDSSVAPFAYAGKSMPRADWSPLVRTIRDRLLDQTNQYYDGCLLNLYPDGQSGMRYHIDPDQGTVWDYDTAVVSVGATRRFVLRSMPPDGQKPHSFPVLQGDVTHMFGNCQARFQHTVKKTENKLDASARSSLVFKRTWDR